MSADKKDIHEESQEKSPEPSYVSQNKPRIRDIQIDDDEIKDQSLGDNDSEVLSRSAIDGNGGRDQAFEEDGMSFENLKRKKSQNKNSQGSLASSQNN